MNESVTKVFVEPGSAKNCAQNAPKDLWLELAETNFSCSEHISLIFSQGYIFWAKIDATVMEHYHIL